MAQHKIAILADTHGLLRPEVTEILKQCELIFHAGDINSPEILEALEQITPLYVVRGNNDKEWAKDIPLFVTAAVCGHSFYMCHKKKDIPAEPGNADFVIFGHSHKYEVFQDGGRTWINPGSCGPRRFHQPVTLAVLTIEDESAAFQIEKIDLSPAMTKENAQNLSLSEKDLDQLIRRIIKDMDAGRSIEQIAARNRVEPELVTSICRMYATHPGVTAAGIIEKLELRQIYGK